MRVKLRPLCMQDEADAVRASSELEQDGFPFLLDRDPRQPWSDYVRMLENYRHGRDLPKGYVPATFLGAVVSDALVGRVSIRHELNEFLTNFGGHIGYCVRPAYRRRGYASEILTQALIIARAEGINAVLITCDEGNGASAALIETHGGVLEDVRDQPDGAPKRRYWIS